MAESVEEMTPLKRKLDEFGTFLSKASQQALCSRHQTICEAAAAPEGISGHTAFVAI